MKSKTVILNNITFKYQYLVLILFVVLPIAGFFAGTKYQQNQVPTVLDTEEIPSKWSPDQTEVREYPPELPNLPPIDRKNATIGYIKKIYTKDNQYYIDVDFAQYLSVEDNTCNGIYEHQNNLPFCDPNGFLIKNDNPKVRTFGLPSNAVIQVRTEALSTEVYVNAEQFKELIAGNLDIPADGTIIPIQSGQATIYTSNAPYWFKTNGDQIVYIWQQYVP